jgi:hypothetical protein
MAEEQAAENQGLVGYFAHAREAAMAWGALVLVTPAGDPVDFLYTDPVTVSRLTHRLLGPRVDAYLVGQVLLQPLLEQAGARLSLLCFDAPALLQRDFTFAVPAAVHAAGDAVHRDGAWVCEIVSTGNGHDHTWWLASATRAAAAATLRQATAAMAPFGILDPFAQLRAGMAEVRGERP